MTIPFEITYIPKLFTRVKIKIIIKTGIIVPRVNIKPVLQQSLLYDCYVTNVDIFRVNSSR